MTRISTDVVTGGILLIGAAAWIAMVVVTIPAGTGSGDVGPRAFPLFLGIGLALLAGGLILSRLASGRPAAPDGQSGPARPGEEAEASMPRSAFGPAILIFLHLVAYGLMMQRIGFLYTSMAVVASVMIVCVGDRSPLRIAAMSLGVPLGVWLVFGKLFGVYLAPGSWF